MSLAIHISYQEKLNTRQVPAILTFHVLFDHPKGAAQLLLLYLSNSPSNCITVYGFSSTIQIL